jgi:glycosyltransferase involved in cell wall biosynthesis
VPSLSDIKLTVTIPVGPKECHKQWLSECINSVLYQTDLPDEILLINDQADIKMDDYITWENSTQIARLGINHKAIYLSEEQPIRGIPIAISMFKTPWLSGVVTAFNYGIALARNEYVLQLGSDDILHPMAIEKAKETIVKIGDPLGLYNFSCQIMGTTDVISWFNHANVVTKGLWNKTGGLHPMTVTGGMDAALISVMMVHLPEHLHKIDEGNPLYIVREHDQRYTLESASRYGDFMVQLRNDLTAEWKEPEWTSKL